MLAAAEMDYEAGMPPYVPPPPGYRPAAPAPRPVLGVRQADRSDRDRVAEICREVFKGQDSLPRSFDRWVEDEDGGVLVADVDGCLAAIHRLVPAGEGIMWYEGLRVAPEFRGRGLGHVMVEMAVRTAARRGYREMRLHAGPECGRFFVDTGFRPLVEVARWDAPAARRGPLPAILAPEHSDVALGWLRQDGAFNRYPGLKPVFGRSPEGDRRNVHRLAHAGMLRFSGETPAFAAVRPTADDEPLRVTFLAGGGDSMVRLLSGMRHAAHVEGHSGVRVVGPADHPCAVELAEAGYAVRDDFRLTVYSRALRPQAEPN